MKLLILDQLQWINFAACTQRPVMITGEVSHGSPFIKPFGTQMGPELCKTLEIRLECMGVCVFLKGQNVLSIPFLFYSLLGV